MEKIDYYTNLSHKILSSSREGKQYLDDREIIKLLFLSKNWKLNNYKKYEQRQKIKARLTLIDSYYSTNVRSRRNDGIDDIVKSIYKIANSDDELRKLFIDFIRSPNKKHKVGKLFIKTFGWQKSNLKGIKAISLISKYGYFLTQYKFPIVDKYVRKYHTRILKYFKSQDEYQKIKLPNSDPDLSIFQRISILNSPINNYEKLDNLLWLTGKIADGNYSLILNKKKHKILVKRINKAECSSSEYIYCTKKPLSDIFSPDLIEFIKFVKKIVDLKK